LVVEVDGSQHQDNLRDRARDQRLHEAGFRVLRFWNNQVLEETDAVVEAIWAALRVESRDIHPSPGQSNE
jgi:very-short-patch-repair endonuclease